MSKTAMTVREWMTTKVVCTKPLDSVLHAREQMERHRINQLPVVDGKVLLGIVTDRDLRDAFPSVQESLESGRRAQPLPKGADPDRIPVEDVMTREPMTLAPDATVAEAAELMREERIGSVPVIESGHLVGILTRSDLLAALVGLSR